MVFTPEYKEITRDGTTKFRTIALDFSDYLVDHEDVFITKMVNNVKQILKNNQDSDLTNIDSQLLNEYIDLAIIMHLRDSKKDDFLEAVGLDSRKLGKQWQVPTGGRQQIS